MDIVEHSGVPRFAFTDFPLGNPLGKPGDTAMQLSIVRFALGMLNDVDAPNTTRQTPFVWSNSDAWRETYSRVDDSNRQALAQVGADRRRKRTLLPKRGA